MPAAPHSCDSARHALYRRAKGDGDDDRDESDMTQLAGKVAVITGATGEIGRATALLMAARGARIVAVGLDVAELGKLAGELGAACVTTIVADVTIEAQVCRYVETAMREAGRIDILFNNAGIEGSVERITDYSLDTFRRVLEVNVVGVFLGMKHAIPGMAAQGGGAIVNTSSVAGLVGTAGLSAYVASKHAVVGLTRTGAAEWASQGIRVNCVNPGPVEGRMMSAISEGFRPGHGGETAVRIAAGIPSRRFGTPEDVAGVVAFLASDDARHVNGAFLTVDGGQAAI
jgi:NAD(P)-dependent dehydrogenase (short-subunit alcohol dehydrogenase family)